MRISKDNTNLRRSRALLRELADLVNDLLWCGFEPSWGSAGIWDGAGRYAFAVAVESTHDCGLRSACREVMKDWSLYSVGRSIANVE